MCCSLNLFLWSYIVDSVLQIKSDDCSVAIKELTGVSGIGPAKAKELYDSGITSIDVLLKNQDKLNHHQKLGLRYLYS